jgi:hypothetical protein
LYDFNILEQKKSLPVDDSEFCKVSGTEVAGAYAFVPRKITDTD